MKILVAGATGFIGSYIVRYLLDEGITVVGLCRATSSFDLLHDVRDRVEWRIADVRDLPDLQEAMEGTNVVINASGVISRRYEDLMSVNVEGTANLINVALYHGLKSFVHISSTAAFGGPRKRSITETDLWPDKPLKFDYGLSKYLAEQEVWRGGEEGLAVSIINPPMVLGGGDWTVFPSFLKTVYEEMSWYPKGSIGVVDVRDIARMSLQLILEVPRTNERYICSSENWSLKDISSTVASKLGVKAPDRILTSFYIRALRTFMPVLRLFGLMGHIPVDFIEYSQHEFAFDNTKSKELLQFEYIPVAESIEATVRSFLDTYPRGIRLGLLPIIK